MFEKSGARRSPNAVTPSRAAAVQAHSPNASTIHGSRLILQILLASLETRGHFAEILNEASAWQRSTGSEGWNYPFNDAWILPRIERRELFLAEQNIPMQEPRIEFRSAR